MAFFLYEASSRSIWPKSTRSALTSSINPRFCSYRKLLADVDTISKENCVRRLVQRLPGVNKRGIYFKASRWVQRWGSTLNIIGLQADRCLVFELIVFCLNFASMFEPTRGRRLGENRNSS